MTADTTPESLIGEAKNYEGDNGTARWPSLITDLAAALTDAQTKLAEREAVIAQIEEVGSVPDMSKSPEEALGDIWEVLLAAPAVALAAHDEEVARKALTDAADAYKSGQLTGIFMGRDDYARGWLRARAEQIGENRG